jgi:hypothetical protein
VGVGISPERVRSHVIMIGAQPYLARVAVRNPSCGMCSMGRRLSREFELREGENVATPPRCQWSIAFSDLRFDTLPRSVRERETYLLTSGMW